MAFHNDNIQHEQSSTKKIRLDPEVARDENKIPTEHSTPVVAAQEQTVGPIQSEEKRVKDKAVLECVNENIFEHMFLRRIVRENHGVSILKTQFNFVKLSKACAETSNNVQALGESPDMAEVIESESDPTCEMDSDSAMDTDIDVKAKDESRVVELDADERYRHTAVKKDPQDTSNILITLSSTQANIYDNEHCGDHLDIMSNYQVDSGLEIVCGGWVSTRNDAVFAVGLANGQIRIIIGSFNVPNNEENSCNFDVSSDGNYICTGNASGAIFIFNVNTGKVINKLHHKRSVRPITCCTFSKDSKSIIYGSDSSLLWRYDYIDAKRRMKWESFIKA
ncbi:hypothetical protein AX774_g2135 [Zancudomyces culisetae]|uniref:Uncharacterized protein n=1 Tax=Zancudomyces culisetae TaxID=1213189 RepID=A0A1R1PTL5_ZANCU|nr:hypothetical protein AX774_g2135 [Zancudomyces culisetae]|eukprot:OMH84335.1 hypothetical protein AX774_g2135 [Zancudomyces culisetae]